MTDSITPTISITLTIQGTPITLTLDEARQLRDLLNQVVPEKKAGETPKNDYIDLFRDYIRKREESSPKPLERGPFFPTLPPYEPLPWSPPFNPTAKPYWLEDPRTFCVDLEAENKRFLVEYDKLPSYAANSFPQVHQQQADDDVVVHWWVTAEAPADATLSIEH